MHSINKLCHHNFNTLSCSPCTPLTPQSPALSTHSQRHGRTPGYVTLSWGNGVRPVSRCERATRLWMYCVVRGIHVRLRLVDLSMYLFKTPYHCILNNYPIHTPHQPHYQPIARSRTHSHSLSHPRSLSLSLSLTRSLSGGQVTSSGTGQPSSLRPHLPSRSKRDCGA